MCCLDLLDRSIYPRIRNICQPSGNLYRLSYEILVCDELQQETINNFISYMPEFLTECIRIRSEFEALRQENNDIYYQLNKPRSNSIILRESVSIQL